MPTRAFLRAEWGVWMARVDKVMDSMKFPERERDVNKLEEHDDAIEDASA